MQHLIYPQFLHRFWSFYDLYLRKDKLNDLFYIVLLKTESKIRNKMYVFVELLALRNHKDKKRKILFSEKNEWDIILRETIPENKFEIAFLPFYDANFRPYDLIVPLTVADVLYCSENKYKLKNQNLPIPSKKAIEICNDKGLFNDFMQENGFETLIPKVSKNLDYPYLLKGRIDEYGRKTFIIHNAFDEQLYKNEISSSNYFCQEIIKGGSEFATHVLFQDGKIVKALNIEYRFTSEYYIKGKNIFVCKTIVKSKYLDIFTAVLKTMNYEGLCCLNYKISNGKPIIFEINPRFGGSLTNYFFSFLKQIKYPSEPV